MSENAELIESKATTESEGAADNGYVESEVTISSPPLHPRPSTPTLPPRDTKDAPSSRDTVTKDAPSSPEQRPFCEEYVSCKSSVGKESGGMMEVDITEYRQQNEDYLPAVEEPGSDDISVAVSTV